VLKTVRGILSIIRPLNGVVAAASLFPALTLATGRFKYDWHVGIVLFLLVSFGYVVNDIYDLFGDRENRQMRPLVSGQLSRATAWVLSGVLASLSLVLSAFHSWELLLYCGLLVAALLAYAAWVSTILLVANLWVAAMCSSVFLLPLLLPAYNTREETCLLLATAITLSFLYHLGREIIKDIEDMRGDLVLRRATLPLVMGDTSARLVAAGVMAAMVAASYGVYFQQSRALYLLVVTLGVNLPSALIFLIYFRRDPIQWAGTVSIALKVIMIPALAALMALGLE
jgi:4-hydroxybenzoate polyprenyltransferase